MHGITHVCGKCSIQNNIVIYLDFIYFPSKIYFVISVPSINLTEKHMSYILCYNVSFLHVLNSPREDPYTKNDFF